MILDIYLMLIAIAFITFILGIEKENIVYTGTSLVLWLIIFAQSFYIEVPGIDNYVDYSVNALCLTFIFINIIWMLIIHMEIGKVKVR